MFLFLKKCENEINNYVKVEKKSHLQFFSTIVTNLQTLGLERKRVTNVCSH